MEKKKDKLKIKKARRTTFASLLFNTWLVSMGALFCTGIVTAALHTKVKEKNVEPSYNIEQMSYDDLDNIPGALELLDNLYYVDDVLAHRKRIIEEELGVVLADHPGYYIEPEMGILSEAEYERLSTESKKEYLQKVRAYYKQFSEYHIDKEYQKLEGYEEYRKQRKAQ